MKAVLLCLALAAGGVLCSLSGCSEKESFTPYTYGGLGTDSLFRSDTSSLVLETSASLGTTETIVRGSRRLVVCNWRGRLARCHLWFSELPDSPATVIRADLFLYATRIQSNSSVDEYEVYALADTLDYDSLSWAAFDTSLQSSTKVTSFSLAGDPSGLIASDSIVIDLTELVSSWVEKETDNCGIAIKLADETVFESIAEFASREDPTTRTTANDTSFYVRPALRISYVAPTSGVARQAPVADTSYAIALSTQDMFLASLLMPLDDSLLACSNGFPSRTYLKFDIPKVPGATVIKSTLTLVPDLAASSFDVMTVACHALVDTFAGFDSTEFGIKGTGAMTLTYDSLEVAAPITMDVTALVRVLVPSLVENNGFLVKSTDETTDLDFVIFASSRDGDPGLSPRLEICYKLPSSPRYRRD